jgi:putative oxidoreductase
MTGATARIGWIGRERTAAGWRLGELAEAGHAVARIGIGALFLQHGLQKLFGVMGGFMGVPGATAPLFSLMGLAAVLEVGGGILLIAGLAARPVALLLAGQMVAAFFMAHAPQGGWPIQNGGELPLLFASAFTLLAAKGAGRASLDKWLAQRRE